MSGPTHDPWRRPGIPRTLARSAIAFVRGGGLDTAATLTFYGLLSIFPAILALVAVAGIVGEGGQVAENVLDLIDEIGPPSARDTFRGTVEGVVSTAAAPALVTVGFATALWSATGWIDAFSRAADTIRGTSERRPFIRRKAGQLVMAIGLAVGIVALSMILVVSGPVARRAADALDAGDAARLAWTLARWPVLGLIAVTLVALLYRFAPSHRTPGRLMTLGAVTAVVVWVLATAVFGAYVASFGSYNATYGALGGVVVFLLWLWITNAALVLGVIVDAPPGEEPVPDPAAAST